ncbi:MAG: M23 family metallopeptidase [Bacteroidota bacterium]
MKYYFIGCFLLIVGAGLYASGLFAEQDEGQEVRIKKVKLPDLRQMMALKTPDLKPVSQGVKMSSPFGMRFHPIYRRKMLHRGVDFPLPIGSEVRATASGIVRKVVSQKGKSSYGKYILINHDNEHGSLYAHLSKTYVTVGQEVKKGEMIGLSGNTGLSTAPHLHYELIKNGKRVNPLAFWK